MLIKEISVKNFRSLKQVVVPLSATTVIIGENNTGKTALMEAIKAVLSRRWGQRGSGFSEYDFYMDDEIDDPRKSEGIEIELLFEEAETDEWPEDLVNDLSNIIQIDPDRDTNSIRLRLGCEYEELADSFDSRWSIIGRDGKAISGGARRAANTQKIFQYVPIFSLVALRDAASEFSSGSQFWGKLLKTVRVPDEQWAEIQESLDTLNAELLAADPRLAGIRDKLMQIRNVVSGEKDANVQIRALPLQIWDLIARAEVIVRGTKLEPWLPLRRHGQGVQSLAILYVFQAFVENLLKETYSQDSEPILVLEEPEAHLHPQATRALSDEITEFSGQKIVSTHSPYFMERVPFRDIRLLRRSTTGTQVFMLRESVSAQVADNEEIKACAAKHSEVLTYDSVRSELTVNGTLGQSAYRDILKCYTSKLDRDNIHPVIKQLKEQAMDYISDSDLDKLQDWARRIRGEIFFARKWLLCEGQTEHALFHAYSDVQDANLDALGVAVIDYQNNGAPGLFAALARALGFPWLLFCDGDEGGTSALAQLKGREFSDEEIAARTTQLPDADIESYLVGNLPTELLVEALTSIDVLVEDDILEEDLAIKLGENKPTYAHSLSAIIRDQHRQGKKVVVPDVFSTALQKLDITP